MNIGGGYVPQAPYVGQPIAQPSLAAILAQLGTGMHNPYQPGMTYGQPPSSGPGSIGQPFSGASSIGTSAPPGTPSYRALPAPGFQHVGSSALNDNGPAPMNAGQVAAGFAAPVYQNTPALTPAHTAFLHALLSHLNRPITQHLPY